ncbi:Ubiquitin domain-containing protein DSK2b [Forsythia ovata]|uniref:Ubiquitin domain-containing protein DSK2b n=1 Tax=Forsythia ovata TaxID=205694 RepID=A0ABD1TBZ8_9LAMI
MLKMPIILASTKVLGGAGLGASLFPGLGLGTLGGTRASGLFGAGLPEFEQMQQQLTQDPNMMREIMNALAIQNIMNYIEIMCNLIMNNPQMRDIIDRNLELSQLGHQQSTLERTQANQGTTWTKLPFICITTRVVEVS